MYTLEQLAQHVKGKILGNPEQVIQGFAPADEAREGEITFLAFPKYLPAVVATGASCVIVSKPYAEIQKNQLLVSDPYYAFVQIIQLFHKESMPPAGISSKAEVLKNVGLRELEWVKYKGGLG